MSGGVLDSGRAMPYEGHQDLWEGKLNFRISQFSVLSHYCLSKETGTPLTNKISANHFKISSSLWSFDSRDKGTYFVWLPPEFESRRGRGFSTPMYFG